MKQALLILSLIALAAAALFWQQVWAIFDGMTVLESLEMIVQYILHVTVVTILMWGVTTLPELIKPWMRALRQKRRAQRLHRVRTLSTVTPSTPKSRKLTVSELLTMLAPDQKIQKSTVRPQEDRVDLKL
jgi:Sec-independent protein translocase protein TatA